MEESLFLLIQFVGEFSPCDGRARDVGNGVQVPRGTRGRGAGRVNWEVETDTDPLVMPCIRDLTNQRPLCRPGDAAQMGRTPSKEGVDRWFTLPHGGNEHSSIKQLHANTKQF